MGDVGVESHIGVRGDRDRLAEAAPGARHGETDERAVAEVRAGDLRPRQEHPPARRDVDVEVGVLQAIVDPGRAAREAPRPAETRSWRSSRAASRRAQRGIDALAAVPHDNGAAVRRDAHDEVVVERGRDLSELRAATEVPAGRAHAREQPDRVRARLRPQRRRRATAVETDHARVGDDPVPAGERLRAHHAAAGEPQLRHREGRGVRRGAEHHGLEGKSRRPGERLLTASVAGGGGDVVLEDPCAAPGRGGGVGERADAHDDDRSCHCSHHAPVHTR